MSTNHYEQHTAFTKPQQRYMDTLVAQHGFRGGLVEAVRTITECVLSANSEDVAHLTKDGTE